MSKKVNKDRLYKAIRKAGYTVTEASVALGYSANYFSQVAANGSMSDAAVVSAEAVLGIKPEEYLNEEGAVDTNGCFNIDNVIEELKVSNGATNDMAETLDDIRYVLNIIARDLKIIKHELVVEEELEEGEESDV